MPRPTPTAWSFRPGPTSPPATPPPCWPGCAGCGRPRASPAPSRWPAPTWPAPSPACTTAPTAARPRHVRHAVEALIRYLLRWTSRPTPFGLFAGIAAVGLADHASVRWGGRHAVTERADAAWLSGLISDLEAQPQVLRRLEVQANSLGFRRGTEWIVPCRPAATGGFADIAVTLSPPVERALGATRTPIAFAALLSRMSEEYPTAAAEAIEGMLTELVALGVLLSGLRPPMTVTDPVSHLASAITALPVPAQVLESGRPRAVDLRLDCAVTLPPAVVRAAQDAASLLAALGPERPVWQAYHAAFLDRYGLGAVVPVREMADPGRGIGYPAGYRGAPAEPPPRLSRRDLVLARLAQTAALEGRTETILDDDLLKELSPGAPTATAPHTELRFTLNAATPAALDSGAFTMIVAGASRQAGTTAGRFLYLLDPGERDRFRRAYQDLPGQHRRRHQRPAILPAPGRAHRPPGTRPRHAPGAGARRAPAPLRGRRRVRPRRAGGDRRRAPALPRVGPDRAGDRGGAAQRRRPAVRHPADGTAAMRDQHRPVQALPPVLLGPGRRGARLPAPPPPRPPHPQPGPLDPHRRRAAPVAARRKASGAPRSPRCGRSGAYPIMSWPATTTS